MAQYNNLERYSTWLLGAFFSLFFVLSTEAQLTMLPDTQYVQISDCGNFFELCLDIPLSDINQYDIAVNGAPPPNGINLCNLIDRAIYDYTGLHGQGQSAFGPFILQSWEINGSNAGPVSFPDINALVDSMNVLDPIGDWRVDATNLRIIGGDPSQTYSDIAIFAVAITVTQTLQRQDFQESLGTLINIPEGFNSVELLHSPSTERDTIYVGVTCVQDTSYDLVLDYGSLDTICLDFSEINSPIESVQNICPGTGRVQFSSINSDSCVVLLADRPGRDTSCWVACDGFGICDTTYIYALVNSGVATQTVYDTVDVDESIQRCTDVKIFAGTPGMMSNFCLDTNNDMVEFALEQSSKCITYSGLRPGDGQACIELCDDENNCDTTFYFIHVRDLEVVNLPNRVVQLGQTDSLCDFSMLTQLTGTVDSIVNICASTSGTHVDFTIDDDTDCIYFTGLDSGIDSACLILYDDAGNNLEVRLMVEVIETTINVVVDSIPRALPVVHCLDGIGLPGTVQDTLYICEEAGDLFYDYDLDHVNRCVSFTGKFPGTDSLCLYVCDDGGICDTTVYSITVLPDAGLPPICADDSDTTSQGRSVVIDVLSNDDLPDQFDPTTYMLTLIDGLGPSNGTATVNPDYTITYTPDPGFCGELDAYDYLLCNVVECDTGRVRIYVECPRFEDVTVCNGFSPNNDGLNDYLTVKGLDTYPNHRLQVFNRWGNLVLDAVDYQNDWNGSWNGVNIPDGTYFYVIDTGEGDRLSGYILIQR